MTQLWRVLEQAERDRAAGSAGRGQPDSPSNGAPPPFAAPAPPAQPPDPVAPPGPGTARAMPGPRTDAHRHALDDRLVSLLCPASFLAEPYRAVRHLLEQMHRTDRMSVVAVSSAGTGEGKTITAINVAGALAQGPEARVLLIDADLRRPSIADHLALRRGRGLVDAVLDRRLTLADVTVSLPAYNLRVVPAGSPPPAPYEILESHRLGDLLAEARRQYDFVVLDTAPFVPVPDSRLLAPWVDGFLMIVAAHKTPRKLLAELLNTVEPAKLVGLLFNGDDEPLPAAYAYGAPTAEAVPVWRRLLSGSARAVPGGRRTTGGGTR